MPIKTVRRYECEKEGCGKVRVENPSDIQQYGFGWVELKAIDIESLDRTPTEGFKEKNKIFCSEECLKKFIQDDVYLDTSYRYGD